VTSLCLALGADGSRCGFGRVAQSALNHLISSQLRDYPLHGHLSVDTGPHERRKVRDELALQGVEPIITLFLDVLEKLFPLLSSFRGAALNHEFMRPHVPRDVDGFLGHAGNACTATPSGGFPVVPAG
jgi:hypothetical protein